MIVVNTFVRTVLFVDLQNAGVLVVRGGEDPGRFSRKKKCGVGPLTVHQTTYDKHLESEARSAQLASRWARKQADVPD